MSFRVTFLGHQGWGFTADATTVLVDPLLSDAIGDLPAPYLRVYPPRVFDLARVPPVRAVVLSHEHPDHFHVPSLARIDRAVPIYLSSLASDAARRVLREMGFVVRALAPGERVTLDALELHGLRPDGRTREDEWDVVPFVVRDRAGHGSFFSSVDLSPTAGMVRELRAIVAQPGIVALANNDLDVSPFYAWCPPQRDQSAERAASWAEQLDALFGGWAAPKGVLLYGGGFAFDGDQAWLNRVVFNCDGARAAAAMARSRTAGTLVRDAVPGETFVMERGVLRAAPVASEYLAPAPREQWPEHGADGGTLPRPEFFAPSSGRTRVTEGERAFVTGALAEFARFLYGGSLFRELYALSAGDAPNGRRNTVAFVARADAEGAHVVWAYDPQSCSFVIDEEASRSTDPCERFVASAECWATDLHDLLAWERTSGYVVFGRMRFRNALPDRLRSGLDMALYVYFHPLRHPDRFYALYRRLADLAASNEPRALVRAATIAPGPERS